MPKMFITVTLILDALRNERDGSFGGKPKFEEAPRFLDWQEGYLIQHKNDRSSTWKVAAISTGAMKYDATVTLTNVDDPEETRTLRGATIQNGYQFLSRSDVPPSPEEVKKMTKPMTIAVRSIKTFSPRKQGRPGTRIVLEGGASYACVEDHDTILGMINGPDFTSAAPLHRQLEQVEAE